MDRLQEFLGLHLFQIGETPVTVATLLTSLLVLVVTFVLSGLVRRAVRRWARKREVRDTGSVEVVVRLAHYALMLTGICVALETAGIDLSALFAAGAIFAVGLGFAMQSIAQNFVSGVILLMERAIKPNDILEVEGRVVRVIRMGIRSTIARTLDGEDMIVPNSVLIQSTVKNYTLQDSLYRVRCPVGVVYRSDMAEVRRILEGVGEKIAERWAATDQPPQVLLMEFGDNAVIFEVAIWMKDPWKARPARSELNDAIWWAFHEAGIVIAFPQLDVHFDPPVNRAFEVRASA